MLNCLFVGLGGFTGAICRYLMSYIPINAGGFPFTTLLINFLGAVLIGAFSQCAAVYSNVNPTLMLFLTTGVCGGFTTFSTFSLETVRLLESGKITWGLFYIVFSILLCLCGILIGRLLTKAVFS